MLDVEQITQLQRDTVARWHQEPIDNSYEGFLNAVCEQHTCNYKLWHEEDIARRTDVTDAEIAKVKRAIDKLNQQRNDWIERLDMLLLQHLESQGVPMDESLPLNTETPGSAVDRLSILALRLYHLKEIVDDAEASSERREKSAERLAIAERQHLDLSHALKTLWHDITSARRRFALYRQMKMYNDPMFNPYLVKQGEGKDLRD